MAKEVIMPALGMAQDTGILLRWYVAEGEFATQGEPLMEIETDKVTVEIDAPASGRLANVTAYAGDEIPVGQTIGLILADGELAPMPTDKAGTGVESAPPSDRPKHPASPVAARIAEEHSIDLSAVTASGKRIQKEDVLAHMARAEKITDIPIPGRILASPKARRLAKEADLDLASLIGSGPDGAVLAADVLTAATASSPETPQVQLEDESVRTGRQWLVMAQRLTESWTTVPHFYLERDVNAVKLLAWQQSVAQRLAGKITLTDLIIRIVATALRGNPRLNAYWLDDKIMPNKAINVGIAVDTEEGVVAPVIHEADQMNLRTLSQRRQVTVARAKSGKSLPEDLQGGTFTISNLGMYGIDAFNAIVVPPQAAILAVGRIADRVVAVGGQPAVHPMMTLTLSCDHRVVDGAIGAKFLQTVVRFIEDPIALLD